MPLVESTVSGEIESEKLTLVEIVTDFEISASA